MFPHFYADSEFARFIAVPDFYKPFILDQSPIYSEAEHRKNRSLNQSGHRMGRCSAESSLCQNRVDD
jgi:hypothetical protein